MCAVCDEERKKHEKHHLVNYERYVKLFNYIQKSFAGIKQNITERERMIKEFRELIVLLLYYQKNKRKHNCNACLIFLLKFKIITREI